MLVVASAVVVAVQDEKAEKGDRALQHSPFCRKESEGVDPLRPQL